MRDKRRNREPFTLSTEPKRMGKIIPRPKRKGWQDATLGPSVDFTPAHSDCVIYNAQGQRIGVIDRMTRERRMDAA